MTILVDWEIRQAVEKGEIVIDPFDHSLIQPNSIDVRLADQFRWYDQSDIRVIDPYDKESLEAHMQHRQSDSFVVYPGVFVLGATMESFTLPADIVGQLTGKSSLARIGIMVHVTAGYVDAGFSHPPATLTLEIVNVGCRPVRLRAGMPIAQLVLTRTETCETPYNLKHGAKYNNQLVAAPSLYHLNEKLKVNDGLGT